MGAGAQTSPALGQSRLVLQNPPKLHSVLPSPLTSTHARVPQPTEVPQGRLCRTQIPSPDPNVQRNPNGHSLAEPHGTRRSTQAPLSHANPATQSRESAHPLVALAQCPAAHVLVAGQSLAPAHGAPLGAQCMPQPSATQVWPVPHVAVRQSAPNVPHAQASKPPSARRHPDVSGGGHASGVNASVPASGPMNASNALRSPASKLASRPVNPAASSAASTSEAASRSASATLPSVAWASTTPVSGRAESLGGTVGTRVSHAATSEIAATSDVRAIRRVGVPGLARPITRPISCIGSSPRAGASRSRRRRPR